MLVPQDTGKKRSGGSDWLELPLDQTWNRAMDGQPTAQTGASGRSGCVAIFMPVICAPGHIHVSLAFCPASVQPYKRTSTFSLDVASDEIDDSSCGSESSGMDLQM